MKPVLLSICVVAALAANVPTATAETSERRVIYNFNLGATASQTQAARTPAPKARSIFASTRYKGKRLVDYATSEKPGTVIVDTKQRKLYLTQPNGKAWLYGVGVGRQGFQWSGVAKIQRKVKWPRWTPPKSMIKREPKLAKFTNGMPGGPDNPLGARALYLFKDGRDTLYRLHGTSDAGSIGNAVSSGCIRILNAEVIDLYNRVGIGAKVIVR